MNPFNTIVATILVVCGAILVLKGNPVGYVLWAAVVVKVAVTAKAAK